MLDVSTVSWRGKYGNCTPFTCGPAPTFEIRISSDGGGASPEPANVVCLHSVQYVAGFGSPPAGGYQQSGVPGAANVKTFRAKLQTPCQLVNGVTYWVAVQAKLMGPTNWKWRLATGPALGNPGDWQRRLHPLCPIWNNGIYMETCLGFSPGSNPNYLFRIN